MNMMHGLFDENGVLIGCFVAKRTAERLMEVLLDDQIRRIGKVEVSYYIETVTLARVKEMWRLFR
jgi:hypothetical protein